MICSHRIDGNLLHRLHILSLASFIFFGLNLLVPFELVICKERLIIRHSDRLGIPGQALIHTELIYTGQIRIYRHCTSCERQILRNLKTEAVLKVI